MNTGDDPGWRGSSGWRGWHIVAALTVAQACSLGMVHMFGLLVEPVAAEFDASVAAIGAGMSIFVFSMALGSAFLGPLFDRGIVRPTMLAGVVAMVAGMTWAAHGSSLATLAVGLAVGSAGIAAYGPVPCSVVLMNWFERRRGTAIAIAAAGPPLIGFVVPISTVWLIEIDGWRTALTVVAWVLGAIALPVIATFVVAHPEDVGQTVDGVPESATGTTEPDGPDSLGDLLRERDFWQLAVGFGLFFAVPVGTGMFMVPLLLELEFSPWVAAMAATATASANLLGTIGAGAIADRFRTRPVLLGVLVTFVAALLVIGLASAASVVFAALLPLTFCFGAGQPLLPLIVGRRFGVEVVGRALGITGPIGLPFMLAAAPLGGLLRDVSGSYRTIFLGGAAVMLFASLLLATMRMERPPSST